MPVVDASVVVDWVVERVDPGLPSLALLDRLAGEEDEVLAPSLVMQEVSNALLTGVRRGRWTGAEADASRRLLQDLPARITDDSRDLWRAWELSRRYDNHPIYDLVYVALAERMRTVCITADTKLRARLTDVDWVIEPSSYRP